MTTTPSWPSVILSVAICCLAVSTHGDESGGASAASSAIDESRLDQIEGLVRQGIEAGDLPGAVVLIGCDQKILLRAAWGLRQAEPVAVPMTVDTVFDLASLTKPVATATAILQLAERGQLRIDDPIAKFLPEFATEGKENVTVAHLLTHTSGLIADNSIDDYAHGRDQALERICRLKLQAPPGEKFIYSDVGFITLGFIIEKVSGQPENVFCRENIFEPLGMRETGYRPGPDLRSRAAPTEQRDGEWMRGEVHDPRAWAMGGVAGHAGLFSTADDLERYAKMVLAGGTLDGKMVLSPQTVELMLISRPVGSELTRTWGWDRQTGYSINRGAGMSDRSIGHGGFTGTGMWIDPERRLYVIFLSNRLHPDGRGNVNRLIGKIGTIAVEAIDPSAAGH